MHTERIQAFSDGIFAILITILVLEFKIPAYTSGHLYKSVLNQWPIFLAYIMTFIYIGILWMFHHDLFEYIRVTTITLNALNLFSIFLTTMLSYSMSLLSTSLSTENAADIQFATGFYSLLALGISLSYYLIYRYIAASSAILCSPDTKNLFQTVKRYPLASTLIYAAALLFSVFNVWLGFIFLAAGIVFHCLAYWKSARIKD